MNAPKSTPWPAATTKQTLQHPRVAAEFYQRTLTIPDSPALLLALAKRPQ